jgi:phenylacetate-CoA ligase
MLPTPGLRSALPGIAWPAVPGQDASAQLALLFQFDQSQWWSARDIEAAQREQLRTLLSHAAQTVPFYRDRLKGRFEETPLLTRTDVQDGWKALRSRSAPKAHGKLYVTQTSGSTGQPVKVVGTELGRLFWRALTVREHLWHERDFSAKVCAIRVAPKAPGPDGVTRDGWGPATDALMKTGPIAILSLSTDVGVQARWLERHDPDYLLSYPSNLLALARLGVKLTKLREVRTIGETVTPALREAWKVPITDVFSSQEVGYIALQCPSGSGLYHVQSESLVVEVLDEAGKACAPGEVGRVVVTTLHNFAMPLIRYDTRDYAEAGEPCPCGRGLPTLRRVLGRKRNMLVLPNGEKRWPLTGFMKYREVAPVRQYQLVQLDLETIEARLVSDRRLTEAEEAALAGIMREWLGHPFQIRFVHLEAFPPHPGGKFEDFISLLDR